MIEGCFYMLKNHTAIPCDIQTFAAYLSDADRTVARTERHDIIVSTVFLGIDHSFGSRPDPQIFETMIFGGEHSGHQTRCSTWNQAQENHSMAVALAFPEDTE
jgi:hypothetical protein